MDGCTIADAAARTGFSASALRFYEQEGLVAPGRTPAGYRIYDERTLTRLGFIARAKGLGLSLDEIRDLTALWDEDDCGPVQDQLRALVADKIIACEAQARSAEALARQLRHLAAGLEGHRPDGPCDGECGCIMPVEQAPEVACTLEITAMPRRVADWRAVNAEAVRRESTATGMRLVFARGVDVGRLAALAAAEQGCCAFLRFDLGLGVDRVTLDITGADDARPVIEALAAL